MVDIVMPVYNGARFLEEQIESIINQTYTNWVLKIRNDGSTDNSQDIIDKYCKKYPNKIVCIKDINKNIGLVSSLNVLLNNVDADYIMFADQDDVWFPNKIQRSLMDLQSIELCNNDIPVMVCTDVTCVDENKNILAESFFMSQHFLDNIIGDRHKMLALNEVQGCTIMINKAALKYILPLPSCIKVHDMWIALITLHYGKISYLKYSTMYYRQHNNNTIGSKNIDLKYFIHRFLVSFSTIKFYIKLSKYLPFKLNITLVIYYKFIFTIKRLLNNVKNN